ncbi:MULTISPECIES: PilX N-terminal domain-containing pilus assembly protein [Pseudomonas]|uniref:pilus assembly PilX family protein n=1 Tax=Pseudomonas TaxID=286 RepID=UPI0007307F0C|nr:MULTISPECIES: PilX N-terminal domain-containing pilus assembly protein [Pseudomonas]KSW26170.1 hypothetical protein AOX63_21250 [Pseudomonas sp. ADP]OBP10936.1 hypothetical protein BAE52_11675 [Pseudomonas sp. EGD-AKN5]QOF82799.1 hypothetical protein IG194_19720 [Pseudomonas sp. ADPe]
MKQESSVHYQRGAVLFISLILLLVVTLLAISSMRGTVLEERLVGNLRSYQISAAGAESALREGENRLAASLGPADTMTDCSSQSGMCVLQQVPANTHPHDWDWWDNDDHSQTYNGNTSDTTRLFGLNNSPRWFAAFIGFDPQNSKGTVEVTDIDERRRGVGPYYYQLNAAAQGDSQRIMVMLQSSSVQRY